MKKTIFKYTCCGTIFGFFFPLGAILFEYFTGTSHTFSLLELHKNNHLLYMIDTAPIFLGLFAAIGGYFRGKADNLIMDLKIKSEETERALRESDIIKEQLGMIVDDIQKMAPLLKDNVHTLDHSLLKIIQHLDSTAVLAINSIENIAHTLKGLSKDASLSSQQLDDSLSNLKNYNKNLKGYGQRLNRIEKKIQASNNQLLGLVEHSKSIYHIIDVLKDIVSNTQLIAFNASIEAAKLDSKNSTFMVIAKEINKLSAASSTAIDDIAPILQSINNELEEMGSDFQHTSKDLIDGALIISDFTNMMKALSEDIIKLQSSMDTTTNSLILQSDKITEISRETKTISTLQDNVKTEIASSKEPMKNSIQMVEDIIAKISFS